MPDPVRIRTAEDLFQGLRHPDPAVRLPVLAAVAAQPELVLAYGPHEGVDLIEELCRQLDEPQGIFARPLLDALTRFEDPRVVARCDRLVCESPDPGLVEQAVTRASRAVLGQLLFHADSFRAAPAARALAGRDDLTPAEQVRAELWTGLTGPAPLGDLWLDELRGPLRSLARRRLEERKALAWLETQALDDETTVWLLDWADREGAAADLLEKALSSAGLARAGLEILARNPRRYPELRPHARAWLESENPHERALAWRAVPLTGTETLDTEPDPEARLALAARLVEESPGSELLLALSAESDWRLRSLAARGWLAMGNEALAPARSLALAEDLGSRAVGARVLVELNDYEWMEEHLIR